MCQSSVEIGPEVLVMIIWKLIKGQRKIYRITDTVKHHRVKKTRIHCIDK